MITIIFSFYASPISETEYEFIYSGSHYNNSWYESGIDLKLFFGDGDFLELSRESLIPGTVLGTHTYADVDTGWEYDALLSYQVYVEGHAFNPYMCGRTFQVSIHRPPCDCHSFQPEGGKVYWLSAWVQEEHPSQVKSYESVHLELNFLTDASSSFLDFYPTGEIIDGWQRIVGKFTMPMDVNELEIELNAHPVVDTYFDDIRIHPFNGSMKSYVYDGETFWLTSELDDNNYATFYEYDEEGGLIRIKKETARGIVTIQETRSNTIKKENE